MNVSDLSTRFKKLKTEQVSFTKYMPPKMRVYFDNKYRMSIKQKTFLFRQLSYLIESGYSIELTLRKIRGEEGTAWHKAILRMIEVVKDTGSLTRALEALRIFTPEVLYQVEGGELSGELPAALLDISKSFEASRSIANKVRVMMIYPVMLIVMLFAVIYIISAYVMPQVMEMVRELNVPLTPLSKVVLFLSGLIAQRGVFLLLFIALLIVAVNMALKQKKVREFYDGMTLKMVIVKNIVRMSDLINYCKVFKSLFRSGVGLEASLDSAAKTVRNCVLKKNVLHSKNLIIKDGMDFAEALSLSKLFDETEVQLIDIGAGVSEEKMCEAFETMAVRTMQELDTQVKTLMSVIEPVSILIVGVLVGLFVVGVYSPVFSIIFSM